LFHLSFWFVLLYTLNPKGLIDASIILGVTIPPLLFFVFIKANESLPLLPIFYLIIYSILHMMQSTNALLPIGFALPLFFIPIFLPWRSFVLNHLSFTEKLLTHNLLTLFFPLDLIVKTDSSANWLELCCENKNIQLTISEIPADSIEEQDKLQICITGPLPKNCQMYTLPGGLLTPIPISPHEIRFAIDTYLAMSNMERILQELFLFIRTVVTTTNTKTN
jgi:hypothetical protein